MSEQATSNIHLANNPNSPEFIQKLAKRLRLPISQVSATVQLLSEGGTIPFIARYRKEMTGNLDEVQILAISSGMETLLELENRRQYILKTIEEQQKLTPELEKKIQQADTLTELEDLYLPYKPKRRTRATIAREKGLEPLATLIFEQQTNDLDTQIQQFISIEKGVENADQALAGARDIIAEWINENADARNRIRLLFNNKAQIISKVAKNKEEEAVKYKQYFDWAEPIKYIPSHRFLAIQRAANENLLSVCIEPDTDEAIEILNNMFVHKNTNACTLHVKTAAADTYKRLMSLSIENEVRSQLKEKADKEAINVFGENVREVLMSPPMGQKNILAIDPGYRTGCKTTILDKQGKLLHYTTLFFHENSAIKRIEALDELQDMCKKYDIEAIAIGNGTAGRETFEILKNNADLPEQIKIVMVNESGASIYSASEVARLELGDYDLTVRGSVSIGRRLADPLAELVKIDPKSIGVGQYQYDVDQNELKKTLDNVVISCVNKVGVEINTASKQLLTYVSGIGEKIANNIIQYRNQNGAFETKAQLKKVLGVGPKAFEQAAGFIRIQNAQNPLDASAVHPESYPIVQKMATDLNCSLQALTTNPNLMQQIDLQKYITQTVGLPTLQDIVQELKKPGRDPRQQFDTLEFDQNINTIEDLKEGLILNGVITNVTNFGAFVDIGIKQNGLVHISHLSKQRITDPHSVVKVNQRVKVKILTVNINENRIQLSMKEV